MIGSDSGSSDYGPYYLGTSQLQKSPTVIRSDLERLILGARRVGAPFITGSAGGAGTRASVAGVANIVRDIASQHSLKLKLATINAELSPEFLRTKIREGKVKPLGDVEPLAEESLEKLTRIVGMMGEAPFQAALEMGADVILAGRSCDPAIFASFALSRGVPPGIAWHAGKCIDKGGLATTKPLDGSPVLARLREDHFTLEPTRPDSICTVASVSRVVLHENPDPFEITQPTGVIDTRNSTYEEISGRAVKVCGSRYKTVAPSIKVEGAELVGYRTLLMVGIRDPRVLEKLDEFLAEYRRRLDRNVRALNINSADYQVEFRVFGRNAVMGVLEPRMTDVPNEIGLVVDLIGRTEEISAAVGSKLGPTGSRLDIIGRLGGGGNFAYPFSPSLIKCGPAYKWGVWHVVDTDDREINRLFGVEVEAI
jgi:hypothetical protein